MCLGYPPPDYIMNNWTEELFWLMVDKTNERFERMRPQEEYASEEMLQAQMGDWLEKY